MFGRKKKNQVSIAGLPSVDMSVLPSAQPIAETSIAPADNSSGPGPHVTAKKLGPVTFRASMTIDGGTTVIDARTIPGLRDELLKAVEDVQSGGDPSELQDAVAKAMAQGASGMPPLAAPPVAPVSEDPLDRLEKLNHLRMSGALSDAEFEAQKAKILGGI